MKRESRSEHNPVKTKSEEAATIASMLAPLEEQEGLEGADGASFSDTGELKLPKGFIEEDKQGEGFGLEPAVIFILVLVLGFIAFIAYLISVEPPK
ncbi:MAG TPA: hypothetical protein VGC66_24015 [Pyrinomonadaceae bacterium]|jgi:hypothetical protein